MPKKVLALLKVPKIVPKKVLFPQKVPKKALLAVRNLYANPGPTQIQDQGLSRTLSIPGFSQSQGTPYPLSEHGLGEYQPAGKIHWGQIVLDLKL